MEHVIRQCAELTHALDGRTSVGEVTPDGLDTLHLEKQAQTVTIPLADVQEGKLLLIR